VESGVHVGQLLEGRLDTGEVAPPGVVMVVRTGNLAVVAIKLALSGVEVLLLTWRFRFHLGKAWSLRLLTDLDMHGTRTTGVTLGVLRIINFTA
jgi:hypothetical protein